MDSRNCIDETSPPTLWEVFRHRESLARREAFERKEICLKKYWKQIVRKGLPVFMAGIILFLTGCSSSIIVTKNLAENEIFQVGDSICTASQMLVYLYSTRTQYEEVYGEGIWKAELSEGTLEGQVKDSVLEKAAQIKTMYLMALSQELELNEEEKSESAEAAKRYLTAIGADEAEHLEITTELLEQMYQEYALAKKVYDKILENVTPEISDDEARIITVMDIVIKKKQAATEPGEIDAIEYALQKAEQVRLEALEGTSDFGELAAKYSDEAEYVYSVGKGEKEKAFDEVAFNLSQGEISDVLELKDGYHILKCINTLDREKTDRNKLDIIESRRNEVFGKEYDSFVETLARRINKKAYEELDFLSIEDVKFPNFFDYGTD